MALTGISIGGLIRCRVVRLDNNRLRRYIHSPHIALEWLVRTAKE